MVCHTLINTLLYHVIHFILTQTAKATNFQFIESEMEKVTLDSEQIKSEDGESELSKKRTIKIKNRLGNDKGGPNDSLLFDAHNIHEAQSFNCDICGESLFSKTRLENHKNSMHGTKFACHHHRCDETFTTRTQLKDHMRKCGKTNWQFTCDICGESLFSKTRLENHKNSMHVKRFACQHCDKIFTSRIHFNDHSKLCKSFNCNVCGKSLSTETRLENHKNRVHGIRFECHRCDKTFCSRQGRNDHVVVKHKDSKAAISQYKKQKMEGVLTEDSDESEEKQTKESEEDSGDLDNTRSFGKNTKCKWCGIVVDPRFSSLVNHLNECSKKPGKEKNTKCKWCGIVVDPRLSSLIDHLNECSKKPWDTPKFKCDHCNYGTDRLANLNRHKGHCEKLSGIKLNDPSLSKFIPDQDQNVTPEECDSELSEWDKIERDPLKLEIDIKVEQENKYGSIPSSSRVPAAEPEKPRAGEGLSRNDLTSIIEVKTESVAHEEKDISPLPLAIKQETCEDNEVDNVNMESSDILVNYDRDPLKLEPDVQDINLLSSDISQTEHMQSNINIAFSDHELYTKAPPSSNKINKTQQSLLKPPQSLLKPQIQSIKLKYEGQSLLKTKIVTKPEGQSTLTKKLKSIKRAEINVSRDGLKIQGLEKQIPDVSNNQTIKVLGPEQICIKCEKYFLNHSLLVAHYKRVHNIHVCKCCNKHFSTEFHLSSHTANYHPDFFVSNQFYTRPARK